MRFTFDLIKADAAPNGEFLEWVPGWYFRAIGLSCQKGVLTCGRRWLLFGWFATAENSEAIVTRVNRSGESVLFEADGQFVLAMHSGGANGTLELYRDRFGIIPIVYGMYRGKVAISIWPDNVSRFLDLPDSDHRVAPTASYFVFRTSFAPHSWLEGVTTLTSRGSLRIEDGKVRVVEHSFDTESKPDHRKLQEASVAIGKGLSTAMERRVKKLGKVGAWLSGGTDSSLLVALARKHYSGRIRTIFVGFEDYDRNYGRYASSIASKYDTEHSDVTVDPKAFLNHWARTISIAQQPLNSPNTVGQAIALTTVSGTVDAMLTGEGADSVLGGPYRAPLLLLSRLSCVLSTPLRRAVKQLQRASKIETTFGKVLFKGVRAIATDIDEYLKTQLAYGEETSLDRAFGKGTWQAGLAALPGAGEKGLRGWLFPLLLDYHPGHVLAGRRMGYGCGVIDVFPFLDYEFVREALRLPVPLRYYWLEKKAALRRYAHGFFDREFIDKPKEGFGVPLGKWFSRPEAAQFLGLPLEERSLRRGWWDRRELSRVIELHSRGQGNDETAESVPWVAVNLELWARICLEGDSPELYKI